MQQHSDHAQRESFPTDPTGLPEAGRPELVELADGAELHLRVGPVAKRLGSTMVRMFSYRIQVPDAGLYWYHPHIREDYTQELGLYGNLVVVPADPGYWPPADRELVLTVDDLLIEDGQVAPFSPVETSYAAMGRFGNVVLVGGERDLRLAVRAGEVVRWSMCWSSGRASWLWSIAPRAGATGWPL